MGRVRHSCHTKGGPDDDRGERGAHDDHDDQDKIIVIKMIYDYEDYYVDNDDSVVRKLSTFILNLIDVATGVKGSSTV